MALFSPLMSLCSWPINEVVGVHNVVTEKGTDLYISLPLGAFFNNNVHLRVGFLEGKDLKLYVSAVTMFV